MIAAALVLTSSLLAADALATPEVAFGYLDADGKQILALGEIHQPARMTRASCTGKVIPIKYARLQRRGAKDNGRQTRFNFANSEGHLFAMVDKLAPTDDTCLLGTAEFFATRKAMPLKADGKTACDDKARAAVAAAVGRKVDRCVKLGSFAGVGRVVAASFERQGDELLAGIVLLGSGAPAVATFSAKWDPERMSCWRADDGCEFDASVFKVPFALVGPGRIEVVFLWDGAEGQNAELLRADARLEPVLAGSRYWSPE